MACSPLMQGGAEWRRVLGFQLVSAGGGVLADRVSKPAWFSCVWEWTRRETQLHCAVALPVEPVGAPGE